MSAICQASGKKCFAGPHEAKRACRKVSNKIRVYRCPDCGAFHITKQTRPHGQGSRP